MPNAFPSLFRVVKYLRKKYEITIVNINNLWYNISVTAPRGVFPREREPFLCCEVITIRRLPDTARRSSAVGLRNKAGEAVPFVGMRRAFLFIVCLRSIFLRRICDVLSELR